MSLRTHLQVLEESTEKYPKRPVFYLPSLSPDSTEVKDWTPLFYSQFKSDVETYAKYWAKVLSADGLPRRSVVGLWLAGLSYADVLHIYGITRAGYIPQLCSIKLPKPAIIYELLRAADALALIHDPSFSDVVVDSPVPTHATHNPSVDDVEEATLPSLSELALEEDDIVMIFHTSGSVSGRPKLVPCSLKWLDNIVSKAGVVSHPIDEERQDVSTWLGSMCHIGQTFMLIGALQHGSCTIQPSTMGFSSEELVSMITKCSLNRLHQYATSLSAHLRRAREDPKLLVMLTGLDEVLYCGLPLGREEEQWAMSNGIKIRNLFGSTESGAMLLSIGGSGADSRLLRPIEGTSYDFTPIAFSTTAVPSSSSSSERPAEEAAQAAESVPGHTNANDNLLELVIRSDSGDCPHPSLRHSDGHYHTNDLFLEMQPQGFVFKGRNDDCIKMASALRCNTRDIEDNVYATCRDLVDACIVVGTGRPSPALFVEPKNLAPGEEQRLKSEIIRRIRHFHQGRYKHESILKAKMVIVVQNGTLPRTDTKGNIRRTAVEATYKDVLDGIYGVAN